MYLKSHKLMTGIQVVYSYRKAAYCGRINLLTGMVYMRIINNHCYYFTILDKSMGNNDYLFINPDIRTKTSYVNSYIYLWFSPQKKKRN